MVPIIWFLTKIIFKWIHPSSIIYRTGKKRFKIPRSEKCIFRVGKKPNSDRNFTQECCTVVQGRNLVKSQGMKNFEQENTCFRVRILYFSYEFCFSFSIFFIFIKYQRYCSLVCCFRFIRVALVLSTPRFESRGLVCESRQTSIYVLNTTYIVRILKTVIKLGI